MTDSALSKLNGTPQTRKPMPRRLRLALTLNSLLIVPILSGCATTGTTATDINALCAPWRPISYSSKKDTPETVKQVRVHNKTGQNLKCWK